MVPKIDMSTGIREDLRLSRVPHFERGERVKVATDFRPRPSYVVMGKCGDPGCEYLVLVQCGTGFQRTVPMNEIQAELAE